MAINPHTKLYVRYLQGQLDYRLTFLTVMPYGTMLTQREGERARDIKIARGIAGVLTDLSMCMPP